MKVEIEKITPARAKELLSFNTHNRNLQPRVVRRYAEDMTSGSWRPNSLVQVAGSPGHEVLLDGQHRMAGVVLADITVEMTVMSGLALADQEVIDTGARRTLGDVLALRKETNSSVLAAELACRWRYCGPGLMSTLAPTVSQALIVLDQEPTLRESIPPTRLASSRLHISHGLSASLHYAMNEISAEDAAGFWDSLANGDGLHAKHPILVLRHKFEENAATPHRKLDRPATAAYIIKAWNAYMRGLDMTILRWTRGGVNAEPFPELEETQD